VASLREAISGLPVHFARAVEYVFFDGLRYAEITELTGIPKNTLKSHVLRARAMLRTRLERTIAFDYREP
jgi:RNA polymerase sigma-70 factor (ECF subfamily)